MERSIVTSRKAVSGAFKAWLLAGVSMTVVLAAGPALGQVPADERVYRQEALAHAGAIEAAWRRLESFILNESTGPAGWTGAVPPVSAGWQVAWTARGLEARYCGDTLLVYLAPQALKGVGPDHRAVHAAPHAYGGGEVPVLHWLENGRAQGGAGRAAVALPACLSEAAQGGPLPSGRAALAGGVPDPWRHTTERVSRERREEPCGDGEHGEGRTLIREVTQTYNGRGEAVGDPVEGGWQVLIDALPGRLQPVGALHARLPLGRGTAPQPAHGGPRGLAAAEDGDGAKARAWAIPSSSRPAAGPARRCPRRPRRR